MPTAATRATKKTKEAPLRDRRMPQPISAAEFPDALLTSRTVIALAGPSMSSLLRAVKRGELAPIRMSRRCTRYRAGEVTEWLRGKVAP